MTQKQALMSMIDELPPDDLEAIYQYIRQRRQVVFFHKATGLHQVIPEPPQPAENMREEVNKLIDEAINLVQKKRETQEFQKVL